MQGSWRFSSGWLGRSAGCALGALLVGGCGDEAAPGPTADIVAIASDVAAETAVSDAAPDIAVIEDISPEKAACLGTALDPAMAAFDNQCGFLETCRHAGSCWCGNTCPTDIANKPKCDPEFCDDPAPKCHCGKSCTGSEPTCTNVVCGNDPPAGCELHDDCVFNSAKPPPWCGCQKMPDHCSCGSECTPNVPKCDAKVCKNYPAKGCTPNTATYTNCYCERCGLIGPSAKCWFVLCPGAQP